MARTPQPQSVTIAPGDPIQQAIDAAPAGSTFQFQPGVWREQEFLARSGDKFIGDPGGGTILSGARVLTEWQREGSLWRCPNLPASFGDNKPATDPLANNLNELFVDDKLQKRVGSRGEVRDGTWWYDGNGAVMGADPTGKTVEYSVTRNQTWDNGATGCLWQDITVEKYCTDAQQGAHHGMRGWTYENAVFRFMHGAGINIGADTEITGGQYIDNGQCGIEGYQSHNAKVTDAEIARNGYGGYNPDWDGGGLKICTADGVALVGNHVHHNRDQGLWGDIDCTNWLVENNVCEDNTGVGIMYEISFEGTIIRNNICRRCGGTGGYGAGGIYISNSQGVEVSGNEVEVKAGNKAIGGGVSVINDGRGSSSDGRLYESKNVQVHHNTITHSDDVAQDGYWLYQPIDSPYIRFDYNTYVVRDTGARHWRHIDQDVTWDELRAAGQEPNGTLQSLDEGSGLPPDPEPIPPDPEEIPTLAPGTYRVTQGTTLIV